MKKLLHFLLSASMRQRVYHFYSATDAYYFATMFDGAVDINGETYTVTI